MEPQDAVTLLWGLAASFQRNGRVANAVLERVMPDLAEVSFPTAVLLLWSAVYHDVECYELARLVLASPLVQDGHKKESVLERLPRATRQQLVDAHRMLKRKQASDTSAAAAASSASLPELPAVLLDGETAGAVVEMRRGRDPVTKAYNVLADALVQKGVPLRRGVPWEALLHEKPAPPDSSSGGPVVPLAIPELKVLISVCDTPVHRARAPNTGLLRSEQRARKSKPIAFDNTTTSAEALQELRRRASIAAGEPVPGKGRGRAVGSGRGRAEAPGTDGAARLAAGDWLHHGTLREAQAAGWSVEQVSFKEYRMALPVERSAKVNALAWRMRGELDRRRKVTDGAGESAGLPLIL
jgi:hypothetical protein